MGVYVYRYIFIYVLVFTILTLSQSFHLPLLHSARSVYERALDVDNRNITLWLKYAEFEMKYEPVIYARSSL